MPKEKLSIPDPEPAEFEEVHPIKRITEQAERLPVNMWVDDWTLLSEVTKTNKELRGYGGQKKWVTVFYGPLKN